MRESCELILDIPGTGISMQFQELFVPTVCPDDVRKWDNRCGMVWQTGGNTPTPSTLTFLPQGMHMWPIENIPQNNDQRAFDSTGRVRLATIPIRKFLQQLLQKNVASNTGNSFFESLREAPIYSYHC